MNYSSLAKFGLATLAYTPSFGTPILGSPMVGERILLKEQQLKLQCVVAFTSFHNKSSSRFDVIRVENDKETVSNSNEMSQYVLTVNEKAFRFV